MPGRPPRPGQGDGLARRSRRRPSGYDIRSFEPGGEERFLEIKTTNGHARTRFWLPRTQYEVAAQNPSTYRVRRVFHFQNGAEMFDIKRPLDAGLRLIPDKYLAVPR
ncbi:DUF3883 domain-containing protein [Bradyrhizobium sp. LB11.1]|uniref:DUF3883 domain-containing protein n=1 Tax=Bradyrhizobium sp. LB11.1 TaxID=3156326 RepID=UPI003395A334